MTGRDDQPGINGGLLQRPAPAPGVGQGVNGFVCTIEVGDFDETERRILDAGDIALAKTALVGIAWQGYCLDTGGNTSASTRLILRQRSQCVDGAANRLARSSGVRFLRSAAS